MKRARCYVGLTNRSNRFELFRANKVPEIYSVRYSRIVGPFRTRRGAIFYSRNPMGQSIRQIERLAKENRSEQS